MGILLNMLPAILIGGCVLLVIPSMVSAKARAMRLPSPIGACNTVLTILITFFVTILNFSITMVLTTYPHNEGGPPAGAPSSLVAFPYILTTDDTYSKMKVVAYCALAIWCGGSFLLIAGTIYLLPHLKNETFHRCALALTVRHRRTCTWFVILEMLSKFVICLSVAIFKSTAAQMQMQIGVFLIYLTCLCTALPYRFLRHTYSDCIFCAGKLCVVYMSAPFLDREDKDSAPILFLIVLIFINFVLLFLSGVYFFLKGKAADPQYDADTLISIRDRLFTGLLPKQNPVYELVPGLDSSSVRWAVQNKDGGNQQANAKLNAEVTNWQTKYDSINEQFEKKDAQAKADAKLIEEKIAPEPAKVTFRSLVQSQEAVVAEYQKQGKKESLGKDLEQMMKAQSGFLKELLSGGNAA